MLLLILLQVSTEGVLALSGLEVDSFLLTALANQKDRLTILKIDQQLEKFVKDEGCEHKQFTPLFLTP